MYICVFLRANNYAYMYVHVYLYEDVCLRICYSVGVHCVFVSVCKCVEVDYFMVVHVSLFVLSFLLFSTNSK